MKKSFLAVAALLGAAVCVSSCSNEDYEEQLYDGTAVAGAVGAAQPVSHDLHTRVVAARTRADRDHIGAFNYVAPKKEKQLKKKLVLLMRS